MRHGWLLLILLVATGAAAQQPGAAGSPDPDDPCAPLPAELQPAAEESGDSEDSDGLGRIGADGLPCPPAADPGAAPPPPVDKGESTAEDEASDAEEPEDFEPDEEISEDYPVPLPSDI